MTLGDYIALGISAVLWLMLVDFLIVQPLRWWLRRRKANESHLVASLRGLRITSVSGALYKVDRCGMCHGSGEHPARPGYRGHGSSCPTCRGSGKVVRQPGSSSCAGPAPVGAEVGSFCQGPAW